MIGKTTTGINPQQQQADINNGFSLENAHFIDILEMDLQKFRSQFNAKHEEPAIDHSKILNSLFEQIDEVDFREEAGFTNEDQKLSKKHYLVTCVEKILETANIKTPNSPTTKKATTIRNNPYPLHLSKKISILQLQLRTLSLQFFLQRKN